MRAGRKYPRTTPAFTETFTETDTLVPIKKSRFKLFRRK